MNMQPENHQVLGFPGGIQLSPDEQAVAAVAVSGCSPEFVLVPGLSGRVVLAVAHL